MSLRLRDEYDWLVLGDHPGALLSACLAARLGLTVLVLSLGKSAKLSISEEGLAFDPETNELATLGTVGKVNGLLRSCLNHCGIHPVEESRIQADGVQVQVVTPWHRIYFSKEKALLQNELKREFPNEDILHSVFTQIIHDTELTVNRHWSQFPELLTWVAPQEQLQTQDKKKKPNVIQSFSLGGIKKNISKYLDKKSKKNKKSFFNLQEIQDIENTSIDFFMNQWFSKNPNERIAVPFNTQLHSVLRALSYGVTGVDSGLFSFFDFISLMALSKSTTSFHGGLSAYREFLLRMAKRLGVHVPEATSCRRVFFERGRLVGVQSSQRGTVISIKGAALGASIIEMKKVIAQSGVSWPHALKEPQPPLGWRFSLSVTVYAEAIPPGMKKRLIFREPGAPVLEVEWVDPSEYGGAISKKRLIYLRTVVPFTSESLQVTEQKRLAARMMRQLESIIPYLEFHVVRIYPDFRSDSLAEWGSLFPYKTLDQIPENIRIYAPHSGVSSSSGLEGLFVVSGEAYPELGTLGPTRAALESVAWVAHRSGLNGPLS